MREPVVLAKGYTVVMSHVSVGIDIIVKEAFDFILVHI